MKKQLLRAKRKKRSNYKKRSSVDEEVVTDLQEEITDLVDEVQDLLDAVEEIDDSLDVVDNLASDVEDEIVDDEARGKGRKKSTRNKKNPAASAAIRNALSTKNAKSTKKRSAEIRSAFAKFVVGQISEQEARSLGIEVGGGSVTIPDEIASEVITYAQEENLLRKYGSTHKTTGNIKYPVLVKKAEANVSKKERSTDMPETDIEFDEILLDPAEFDALATVTKKLIKMSGVDIEEIVLEELKKAYVRKEISYMFNGNDAGNENPGALAKKAVPYIESTPIVLYEDEYSQKLYSELVRFKGQPVTEVLKKSMWIINRAALTILEDMTDRNGNPLLHEPADGVGYRLLGHNVDFTDAADGPDRTKAVFYFGDFSAFHIQDVVGQLEIQRLVEQYARQNKIGFQIYNLLDGQLIYSPIEPAVYRYEVGTTA
ncbi:phage major capsid protein [Sporosarcina sp. FSL K6-5500]|uniref:phage major capsid protein n=1 Tax=Sporosarcina sp. FSL K6-5500 TaxID=2921558 RepID=UPI0030F81286